MSTIPGAKQFCSQSITLSILKSKDGLLLYTPAIVSFSINTEPSVSDSVSGLIILALEKSVFMISSLANIVGFLTHFLRLIM